MQHPRLKRERRHNPRTQTIGHVYLSWGRRKTCRCAVVDLSATGAFLNVGPLRVRVGTRVELAFALDRGKVVKVVRRSALVVRRSAAGVGVLFIRRGGSRRWNDHPAR